MNQPTAGTRTAIGIVPHLQARGIMLPVALRMVLLPNGVRTVRDFGNGLPMPETYDGALLYVLPGGKRTTEAREATR